VRDQQHLALARAGEARNDIVANRRLGGNQLDGRAKLRQFADNDGGEFLFPRPRPSTERAALQGPLLTTASGERVTAR
jgi:hypothetical protein